MPYKSEAQRRYMHAKHPEIAAKWDKKYGGKIKPVKKNWDGGPDFNVKAANEAFDLVMKMTEDEARIFTEFVVADVLETTIEKNLTTLQKRLNQVVAKRVSEIKKATVRAARQGADEEAVAFAKALVKFEEVSKIGASQKYGYVWREEDFERDPSTGRFRMKISHTQKKPLNNKTAESMLGTKTPDKYGDIELSAEDKAAFQDEYRQLAAFLSTVNQSTGGKGNQEVMLHYRDKAGNQFSQLHLGTKPPKQDLADPDTRLIGVEARPTTLTVGGAAFGLSSALGRPMSEAGVRQTNTAANEFTGFSESWLSANEPTKNSNDKLYGRVKAGSDYLAAVAPAGSKMQMAAAFGQFVGSHGPEAEAVFGPPTRKMAYRYRGTERTPDKTLVAEYGKAVQNAKQMHDPYARGDRPVNLKQPKTRSVHQMAADREAAMRRAPTWDERTPGRRVAMDYLTSRRGSPFENNNVFPKKGLYNLQLASGNTPPSEGVIINAEGQLASQAVGYGDDHYLPFNLKNLKELKGGEYIRNRSVGGPTSEDIYTGLMAGARQITVVSRSGTFQVEFQEDFRGGRRHNDKAKRMVRRYEQILDAVQSEQVERQDVDPRIRQTITEEVNEEYGPMGYSRKEIRDEITRRIDEFKSDPEISEADMDRVNRMVAHERAIGGSKWDEKEVREAMLNVLAEDKEYKFRLNGAGYAAALEALREQFPYYIKVRSIPTKEGHHETQLDRGYVEPGRNRPTKALAGLYGAKAPKITSDMGGKFSAREADFQGATRGTLKRVETEVEAPKDAKSEREAKQEAKIEEQEKLSRLKASVALQKKVKEINPADMTSDDRAALEYTPDELLDPIKQRKFDAFAQKAISRLKGIEEEAKAYRDASGAGSRVAMTESNYGMWPAQPFKFDDIAYKKGAPADKWEKEVKKLDGKLKGGLRADKPASSMTDKELEDDFEALQLMGAMMKHGSLSPADLSSIGVINVRDVRTEEQVKERMKNLHKMRALLVNLPDREARSQAGVAETRLRPAEGAPEADRAVAQVEERKKLMTQIANDLEDGPDKDAILTYLTDLDLNPPKSEADWTSLNQDPNTKKALEIWTRWERRRGNK